MTAPPPEAETAVPLPRRATALRLAVLVLLALTVLAIAAPPAAAHPLGNFTTNTSSALLPAVDHTDVVYVLDLAEIPTQQSRGAIADAGGPEPWAQAECRQIAEVQALTIGGQPVVLTAEASAISFPEGQAGLDTLRLTCALTADSGLLTGPTELTYADGYVSGRTGWREVIAVGDGTSVTAADVPAVSETDQLRVYPEGRVERVSTATLTVDPTTGDAAPATLRDADLEPVGEAAGGIAGLLESFTTLVARQDLTPGFILFAVLLSVLLGTAHAVAPGHGKTVIAAYLLGEGGQARHAVALGGTVAVTHTIGVLLLGVIVQTSTTLAPESLYPILGVMGGALFALVGVLLLHRALTRRGHSHDHDHDHDHGHSHGPGHAHDHGGGHGDGHGHEAGHDQATEPAVEGAVALAVRADAHDHAHAVGQRHDNGPKPLGWRMLVLPGLAGGMVPSPSALVVLLGGIALDRTWFGILLVLFYGIGMALALVTAGYLLHRVRFRIIDRLESTTWARVSAILPVATSSLIIVGGLVIVIRSLLTA
ncbi:hypothetical protein BH23ACT9_BH23ACT9_40240 [soil metagenome]